MNKKLFVGCYEHCHDVTQQQNCPECMDLRAKWEHEHQKRLCPRCMKMTTDKQWYGSACFKGICKQPTFWPEKIPERTYDKPVHINWVVISKVDYSLERYPQTMEELCKWWGVPSIGGADLDAD